MILTYSDKKAMLISQIDIPEIFARSFTSAWLSTLLAAVVILQTWRIEKGKRKHEKEMEQLKQKLSIDSEKTKAVYGEHRILADRVFRGAYQLHAAVEQLDYFFNQFHIHLGKQLLVDEEIRLVRQRLDDLQEFGSDARRLGPKYHSLLVLASHNSLMFTGDIEVLHQFAKNKVDPNDIYRLTDTEWQKYRTGSANALSATKDLVEEMTKILGEVEE